MDKVKKFKKKSSEGGEKSEKKVVKPDDSAKKVVKKVEGAEKKEGKAGRPRTREQVEVIGETTLPVAFKSLYKGLKDMGEIKNKKSITNVVGDTGTFCAVPQIGRTAEKVEIFINRSKGYDLKVGKYTELKTEGKSGSLLLCVTSSDKSQTEALELLTKWKKDQPKHVAEHGGKRGRAKGDGATKTPGKVVKKLAAGEEKSKVVKIVKKDKGEKAAEVTPVKKAEKKSAPVVKPVKKPAPKVEDEEG